MPEHKTMWDVIDDAILKNKATSKILPVIIILGLVGFGAYKFYEKKVELEIEKVRASMSTHAVVDVKRVEGSYSAPAPLLPNMPKGRGEGR